MAWLQVDEGMSLSFGEEGCRMGYVICQAISHTLQWVSCVDDRCGCKCSASYWNAAVGHHRIGQRLFDSIALVGPTVSYAQQHFTPDTTCCANIPTSYCTIARNLSSGYQGQPLLEETRLGAKARGLAAIRCAYQQPYRRKTFRRVIR